ncbi:unnamed protein product [marine sediment metagenome]|uniref:Uncharacterized protein n=1 Tax=marine sediment metagenome TaxID=412755 RepID=X1TYS9_9ZZZZ
MHKPCDSFGDNTPLLGLCTSLDKHLQIEALGSKTLKGILADVPEFLLLYVLEQTLFKVGIT